jgi:ribonuclease P protein component
LRSGLEFKRVLQARKRVSGRWFTISATTNEVGRARLGVAVGRRALPKSVHRNRIKRIARERFRRNAERLGAQDVVVRLRASLAVEDLRAAEAELEALFQELIR